MSPSRFSKSGGRDKGPSEVIYRDRTTWAVDAQLASLASSGDDSAFTTLVTRFHPAVFRWALMFANDPDGRLAVPDHETGGDSNAANAQTSWSACALARSPASPRRVHDRSRRARRS